MKTRILALLMLASLPVFAAGTSATLSWTHPTSYVDGSALNVADIKETLIQWRRPGVATVVGSVRVTAPAASIVVSGLTCGNFTFTAQTIMTQGSTASDETGPVAYATGVSCKPNPPTGLSAL